MNNLLKMNNYQLLRNRIYLGGCIGIFLLGFLTARTYETDVLGASGGIAASLSDIFIGMVYDSTFLHIIVSSLLAPAARPGIFPQDYQPGGLLRPWKRNDLCGQSDFLSACL